MPKLIHYLSVVIVCLATTSVFAAPAEKKEKELPKSGTLSTSATSGSVNSKVPDVWGSDNDSKESAAPISGSVSKSDASNWEMKVFNDSDDTYSVNLSVIQKNERGAQVKTDAYSYTLKPKQSERRKITAGVGATSASLDLRSFNNLTKKKTKPGEPTPVVTPGKN